MKNVTLSLETARQMYLSSDASVKQFALDNYTKEELEKKELPKTWEELKTVKGYYINEDSVIKNFEGSAVPFNENLFPTIELTEAALALAQLLQLRDRYNGGWVPNYADTNEPKFVVSLYKNELEPSSAYLSNHTFSFKTQKLRDEFMKNFRDLLEIAKPLL